MEKLSWKEKIIANNKIYLFICYMTPALLILSIFGIVAFVPSWYDYDIGEVEPSKIILILYWISWSLFIFDIILIIIGTIIEHKRMKVVTEYKYKNVNDDKIKAIETTYNGLFYTSKRKRETTCYVFSVLYPDVNIKQKNDISSRL